MTSDGSTVTRRFGDRERELLIKMFGSLGSDNQHEREAARGRIDNLLRQFNKAWADLVQLLSPAPVNTIRKDIVDAVTALGSSDSNAEAGGRRHLEDLLARDQKNWNDLVDALTAVSSPPWVSHASSADPDRVNPLELTYHLLKEYVGLREHEYVAVALWVLHSHCYRHFLVTPRLAVRSPVPDCGKSTLLDFLVRVAARAVKFDSITASAVFHLIDANHPTLLLDEADNLALGLQPNGKLRAIFNSGHRAGGSVALQDQGSTRTFSTFSPLALALPDVMTGLPRTLNSRSITIVMERFADQRELRRLDANRPDPALKAAYLQIVLWSQEIQQLDPDPEMPAGARNRFADNWRPLLAIADALGWSTRAREAMIVFMQEFRDADAKLVLLNDIRKVFDAQKTDRLSTKVLLDELYELDADWNEFHGVRGDGSSHKLKSGELANMLRDFGIKPRPLWPLGRPRTDGDAKCARGYLRSQFEAVWRAYCAEDVTASHRSKTNSLHLKEDVTS